MFENKCVCSDDENDVIVDELLMGYVEVLNGDVFEMLLNL